ncbi:MAG: class I SAM-dependent methyltransferase [Deltaproteobacteria bacterium]|uniref:Class I SAM-dependent methyltransferase n=1 Tax=Candidatus Zymogenus saltonus TaxID=2844893 RepID=A0A9D8KDR1_9DELT|nr:class I SAM-dependent methyltransferase [Candidatus Zymogenus saltonus]
MINPVYDEIGKVYSKYRRADPRFVDAVVRLLDLPAGSIVADIGAGTGNYSRALGDCGLSVAAVEPSPVMCDQAAPHKNVRWIMGAAENIPINNNAVDGVIAIFSLHHFNDPGRGIEEMARVCRGPILLYTFDPREIERPWIGDYFPSIWDGSYNLFPSIEDTCNSIRGITNGEVTAHRFDLPQDFSDFCLMAGWRRPHIYLDSEVRACMSGFALADQEEVEDGILTLRGDLESGRWEEKYGRLNSIDSYDCGYRFILSK